jgi:O-antigen ligase
VLLAFFYGVLTVKDARSLWKKMIWAVLFANLITVLDSLNILDLGLVTERDDGRIGGPIGESNKYAVFIALFLPASVALFLIEQGARRWLAGIGLAATIVALLLTASRGGFVGIVVGAIFGAFVLRRYISSKAVLLTVGGSVTAIVFATVIAFFAGYGDLLYERIVGLSTSGNEFDVSSGRTVIWSRALNKMFEHPISLITGFGWDSYRQFRDFSFAPHNSYLKIFFETGIIGISFVLLALGNVYRLAMSVIPLTDAETRKIFFALILGLSGALVAIFFVDIVTVFLFVWAYIGISMRIAIELRRKYQAATDRARKKGEMAGHARLV